MQRVNGQLGRNENFCVLVYINILYTHKHIIYIIYLSLPRVVAKIFFSFVAQFFVNSFLNDGRCNVFIINVYENGRHPQLARVYTLCIRTVYIYIYT